MRTRYRSALLAILACGVLLPAGCARFDDTAAGQTFTPAPVASPESPPEVQGPGAESGGDGKQARPGSPTTPVPPPQGCKDFDPSVITTCLDTVAAVAGLPGDGSAPSALAGERKSGRVMLATGGKDATDFAKLDVQAAGDGGLTGLAVSPSYVEDQLVFAYITTPADNRVVRFAKGQSPKPVITGIPKGASGNRGTISADNRGALLVATGDAGNPTAAADPSSLAGKLLRIDTSGKAAAGNPGGSLVVAAGLHAPGGVCASADGGRVWVTDRLADKDVLYRVQAGQPLTTPAWTWQDRPGVAGCADFADASGFISVATSVAGNLQGVPVSKEGAVTGQPQVRLDGRTGTPPVTFGRLAGMSMINPQLAVVGTINKDGGSPVSSDDRVVLIAPTTSGGSDGKD
ncbi:PQQ-dependent sugar dehydrogenase [Amycolatopsis rifamycinica]|uniref:Glucose dehydrogenase n=1 Tax=Amycolatopsis rifamycinica TaxID=287986 RepID=A0A066U1S6_9PSEU|nr:PQQ-dependent sugar dehydrogenase [Amycolatopsis rifamycinica]KDN21406.1 glucose dehydrogenase [Amycolatopsis rifamycinica]